MRVKNLFTTIPLIALLWTSESCGTYVGNPDDGGTTTAQPTSNDPNNPEGKTGTSPNPDGSHPGGSNPGDPNQGNYEDEIIVISLADAPIDDLLEVNLLVDDITVKPSEGDWISLELATNEVINLLNYQDGNKFVLGISKTLPSGDYTQIRIMLNGDTPVTAKDMKGEEVEISAPSATSSGIKVQYQFSVTDDTQTNVTLDFDLRSSIKKTGKSYKIQPVVRASNDKLSASIEGKSNGTIVCIYSSEYSANTDDDSCVNSSGSAKIKAGAFKIHFIEAGSYYIRTFMEDGSSQDSEPFTIQEGENKVL